MDPTQTLIDLLSTLQDLEQAHEDDAISEETAELREQAVSQLESLREWLGPLAGYPPKISEVELDSDED